MASETEFVPANDLKPVCTSLPTLLPYPPTCSPRFSLYCLSSIASLLLSLLLILCLGRFHPFEGEAVQGSRGQLVQAWQAWISQDSFPWNELAHRKEGRADRWLL